MQVMSHGRIFEENNATTVKLAESYIADIAGWRTSAMRSFWQHPIFIRKQLVPLFLPKAFVYRHNVALCRKDVLVIRPVERVVLIKQLQLEKDMCDCKTMLDITARVIIISDEGLIAIILADAKILMWGINWILKPVTKANVVLQACNSFLQGHFCHPRGLHFHIMRLKAS